MDSLAASDARLRQTQALLSVTESITRHGGMPELFHDLVGRLRPIVPFDLLLVLLYDADADIMRLHCHRVRCA